MGRPLTNAQLQVQLEGVEKERDAALDKAVKLVDQLQDAVGLADREKERADREAARAEEAARQVAALTEDLAATRRSLRAYKGSNTRAREELEVLRRPRSAEARAVGPLDGRRRRFVEAREAGALELVFSDGKREIRELEPLLISGADAFRTVPAGERLDTAVTVETGQSNKPEVRIAGAGLVDADGRQFAWADLPEPISVPRGTTVQVPKGSFLFRLAD